MLPPGLTPRQVTLYYDSIYDSLIASGQAVPFVYPWAGLGAIATFVYLLVDHRQSSILRWLRYPLFAALCVFQTWCILFTRARHPAGAFGVGLFSSFGVLLVASLMIFNDCQRDFRRIDRGHRRSGSNASVVSNGSASGMTSPMAASSFVWQSYPATIGARLDWIFDMFGSFRGIGWNWQISIIPLAPKHVESQLSGTTDVPPSESVTVSRAGIRRFTDRRALLKHTVIKLIIGYIALDIIKVMMSNDPYFSGYIDSPPPQYLPAIVRSSRILVTYYRLIVGLLALYVALTEAFALGPLFFCGILGPDRIGVRGEAWMNPPDMFGSYTAVFDHGLAGWWGTWWHQTFRFSFEATSGSLLRALGIEKKSTAGKMISLFVAFFLSGCIHAAGSYTQLGHTRPLMGPFRFFMLQPFGIISQLLLTKLLTRTGLRQRTPKLVRQGANFAYVHIWGYFTAPLLLDDFAGGGNFLFEPIAFSPLRGLGLGAKDDQFFCWWDGILFWRSGKHLWDSGIAV